MSDIDVEIFNTNSEFFINDSKETEIEIVDNSIEIEISGLKTLKRFIGLEDTPLYYEDGKFFRVEGNKIVYADIQWKDITGDMSENEALLEEVKELVQDASLEFVNTEIQKHNEDVFAHGDIRQSVTDVSDTLNSKIDSSTNDLKQQINSLNSDINTSKNDIVGLKQKDDTLQEQIDSINSSIGTDIANKLHLLQQEVDENYIELNSNKVNKEVGKGLSSNDLTDDLLNQIEANTLYRHNHDNKDILDLTNASYTREDKTKLDNIEDGAQVNTVTSVNGQIGDVYIPQLEQIQSDWKSVNPESKAYILNKPTKLSDFENDVEYITKDVDNLTNYTQTGVINNLLFKKVDKEVGKGLSANDFTDELLQKLESIEEGAEKNIVTSINGKIGDVYLRFFTLDDDQIITGQNTFLNDVIIGNIDNPQSLNLTGNSNILGDLNIEGNIIQNGEQYETHAQKVYSTNDYITLRDGAVSGLIPGNYSGLEFKLYDGINNGRLVIDNSGTARVGDIGDEQPLLTRDETTNLTDKGVLIWDAENYKAKTSTEYSKTEEFAPVAFSAEYGDLKNVPTKLSQFEDDITPVIQENINVIENNIEDITDSLNDKASINLDNLSENGNEKLATSLMYETGNVSSDEKGYEQLEEMNRSTFDLSKFTVVGSPTITNDGVASGFTITGWNVKTPKLPVNSANIIKNEFEYTWNGETFNGSVWVYRMLTSNGLNIMQATMGTTTGQLGFYTTYGGSAHYGLMNCVLKQGASNKFIITIEQNIGVKIDWYENGVFKNTITRADLLNFDDTTCCLFGSITGQTLPYSSFDLKFIKITVDGKEVFNGNKTGLDVIKEDNYTIVGNPSISESGVISNLSTSNFVRTENINLDNANSWVCETNYLHAKPDTSISNGNQRIFAYGNNQFILQANSSNRIVIVLSNSSSGDIANTALTNTLTVGQTYKIKFVFTGNEYALYIDGVKIWSLSSTTKIGNAPRFYFFCGETYAPSLGTQDLNSPKIYVDGNLIYQPCLKIPYNVSKTGSKIVPAYARTRVIDLYEQEGQAKYYTIDEENKNFTLPMGEIYGMLGDKGSGSNVIVDDITIVKDEKDTISTKAVLNDNSLPELKGIKTWVGTLEEYNSIETKDYNTLYYITDDKGSGGSTVSVDIATTDKAGIVKPDGETIIITEDGTISSIGGEHIDTSKFATKDELFSGNYNDLTGLPVLSPVSFSGSYNDLSDKPKEYSLPVASTSVLGGVKIDGSTITINNGTISSKQYTLPTASTSTLGGVKVDGTSIKINANGIISASIDTSAFATKEELNTALGNIEALLQEI